MGTVNLLEAVRLCQKEISVIIITTDKVYENLEWVYPYRETDRLGGIDPYSASKACSELVVSSYINSFFNPNLYNQHKKVIGVCRAGNVIGGGDWSKDRIIPDIIKAIFKNDIINIRNPKAIRPWQHVLEPLFGYLLLAMNLKSSPELYSGAYNFGPNSNDVFSVEKLVNLCIKIFERGDYKLSDEINSKHEAGILKLDISKAFEKIGWKPLYNAEEAITKTIDWYKIFHNDFSRINEFTAKQINQYLDVIKF
jgi:CDP-glucose 4,6-dehydratase